MSPLGRLLRQWPIPLLQNVASFPLTTKTMSSHFSLITVSSVRRNAHYRSRGVRLPSELRDESTSESESDARKSRNQLKREAQRAVRWGMELASFSIPQIKRILRVASLDQEALEALLTVKKLGSDVREGKRRQFNYIGKLLRDVPPELMDTLIQATKDGDHGKLQHLAGADKFDIEDDEEESEESDYEEEEEGSHIDLASRWFDGLINNETEINNEVYSIQNVDFDRQELRRLVRRVQSAQRKHASTADNEGNIDAKVVRAQRSLTSFLRVIAKQMFSA